MRLNFRLRRITDGIARDYSAAPAESWPPWALWHQKELPVARAHDTAGFAAVRSWSGLSTRWLGIASDKVAWFGAEVDA
jgi:hypothetical protein